MPQIPVIFIQMSLKTQILSFTDISQQCSYATGQAEIEFVGKEDSTDATKKKASGQSFELSGDK